MKRLAFFAVFFALFLAAASIAHETAEPHSEDAASAPGSANFSDADCSRQLECQLAERAARLYWFGCYSDSGSCRCFKGEVSQCNVAKSSFSADDFCAYQFECVERSDGNFQFNCYYDRGVKGCRCFSGDLGQCRAGKSQFTRSELSAMAAPNPPSTSNASNVSQPQQPVISGFNAGGFNAYVIAGAAIAFLVVALVLLFLFRETPQGDLGKARNFHRKAEELHEKGDEGEAHKYYSLAEEYRARARRIEE